ncbi:hypothetical protein [Actinophytocola sp.]|uniref:hypothetical protein n=1 Tax=Actinophytocola sp. TaxID=1872138 RepID=UPI002D7E7662|nr:hypothetical protein [Actinophytocola sp.]HET9142232.1 hypothetical protein [Actinophytocola sp.]
MNDIEQRIGESLRARAALVTEDSLRVPVPAPARPTRRYWPALAAAGFVVLAAAGIGLSLGSPDATVAPPATSSATPPPSSSSAPTTTSTTTSAPATSTQPQTAPPTTPVICGRAPCKVVQTVRLGPDVIELLAAPSTLYAPQLEAPEIRVNGGPLLKNKPKHDAFVDNGSLRCSTVAGRSVCLLHTWYLGDSDTSYGLVKDGSGWRYTGAAFPTPYGNFAIDVRDLGGDRKLEVVAVEQQTFSGPGEGMFTATVWRWDGTRIGCSPRVAAKEQLPGWPKVAPDPATLDNANCVSG